MRLGDLDALKEIIETYRPTLIKTDYSQGKNNMVDYCIAEIDNAPTVPQVTVFAENASKEEIEDFKQELENVLKRPQGEWISDYRTCKCSVCYFTTVIDTYNFCPNCGAKMRGEEE